ncbi:hypothetical protein SERLADRAFT_466505, partial [Serpula lacrymans var. lacrymans S7.9]
MLGNIKDRISSEETPGLPLHTHDHKPQSNAQARLYTLFTLCIFGFLGRSVFWTTHQVAYQGSEESLTPLSGSLRNPAYLVKAEHGAVASENRRCSDIGVGIMKDGGNAVDAAISAAL